MYRIRRFYDDALHKLTYLLNYLFRCKQADNNAERSDSIVTGVQPPVLHVAVGPVGRRWSAVVDVVVDALLVTVVTGVDVVEGGTVVVELVEGVLVVVVVVGVVGSGHAVGWQVAWSRGRVSGSHELSSTRTPDDRRQLTARCWTPWPQVVEHWHPQQAQPHLPCLVR